MLLQILRATPAYVWVLFAALVGLGLFQARERRIGRLRAGVVPLAFVVLSLVGVVTAFGPHLGSVAAWGAGMALALAAGPRLAPRPRATREPGGAVLHVAGSWWPLLLIVALFLVKYTAGVQLAMHPAAATDAVFADGFSFAYGVFGGLFASRGWQLWRLGAGPAA